MVGVSVWCSICRDFGNGCAGWGFVDDGLVTASSPAYGPVIFVNQ